MGLGFISAFLPRFLGLGSFAEPFDLLGFSVMISGPFIFATAFLVTFYGLQLLNDGDWARPFLGVSFLLFLSTITCHLIFLPRR